MDSVPAGMGGKPHYAPTVEPLNPIKRGTQGETTAKNFSARNEKAKQAITPKARTKSSKGAAGGGH
jgi:hypothetical protein